MKGLFREIGKSLEYSVLDGSSNSAMLGLTHDYIAPFAIALNASVTQIGLLSSIPNLSMAWSQLIAPRLEEMEGSRKKFVITSGIIHALMWLPILLIPILFATNHVWWLVFLFALSTVFGSLGNPAWGSMMADLVPVSIKGRYFGLRGMICGFVALVYFLLGGIVLSRFSNDILLGFYVIFGGAILFKLASMYFVNKIYDPPLPVLSRTNRAENKIQVIIKNINPSTISRFMIYVPLINLAMFMSRSFISVHILRDLDFSYWSYIIIIATFTVSYQIFLLYWGNILDRSGNVKVLKITAILSPMIPILWITGHQIYSLMLVQVFAGFVLSGFHLSSMNIFYSSYPESRMRRIAIFNAFNGGAICIGSLIGSTMTPHLPVLFGGSGLMTMFLISGIATGVMTLFMLLNILQIFKALKVLSNKRHLFPLHYMEVELKHLLNLRDEEFFISPGCHTRLPVSDRSPPSTAKVFHLIRVQPLTQCSE
ncbi:MAG: MFS transporter [Chloroflexi bacterium]|nr:MFS transporter [Chloroflexota bacterium]